MTAAAFIGVPLFVLGLGLSFYFMWTLSQVKYSPRTVNSYSLLCIFTHQIEKKDKHPPPYRRYGAQPPFDAAQATHY